MVGNQGNILIVDDQPNNLRLLSKILADESYKVRKVLDGRRALDAAQLDPPDLILLDIMMPDLTGYEVCHSLKAQEQTQDIPVIFLSALDAVEDKVKALETGGVDYITKPFQKEEVLARVSTHLKLRRLAQTLKAQNTRLSAEVEQRKAVEMELTQTLQDLKMAQAQIIAREKLASLGTLTAGIAHELRNPLNFVTNYAEGSLELVDDLLAEVTPYLNQMESNARDAMHDILTELRENCLSIHQHGQRAERIISSMMQHARTEADKPCPSDIHILIDEALDLVYHSMRFYDFQFNVSLEKKYDPAIGLMDLFPNDLSRAFINLLDNACYAVYQKCQNSDQSFSPKILIQTRRLDENVEIRIWDNGTGIQLADQKKILEPFFSTKPTGEGTGLGLSITHEIIVGQHQGSLILRTEPGEYTEFLILIPIHLKIEGKREES